MTEPRRQHPPRRRRARQPAGPRGHTRGLHQNLVRANSGTEALRQVLDHDFAVILLDIQMTGPERHRDRRGDPRARALAPHPDHLPHRHGQDPGNDVPGLFRRRGRLSRQAAPDRRAAAKVGVFIELAQARQRLHQEIEERTKTAVRDFHAQPGARGQEPRAGAPLRRAAGHDPGTRALLLQHLPRHAGAAARDEGLLRRAARGGGGQPQRGAPGLPA